MIHAEIKNISTCKKELTITLDKEDLNPIREREILRLRKEIDYPGFRKGKAPLSMVKKRFADAIEAYTLEGAADESLRKAAEENNLQILDQPEAKKIEFNDEGNLVSIIEIETYPEFELKKTDKFNFTKDKYIVTEKLVDQTIENIRRQKAEISTAEGPIENGHIVILDMHELGEKGQPVEGKLYNDINVRIGEEKFDPELEKQLIGLKNGDVKEISKVYPDDFPQKDFAGKKETYSITIKNVQKEELPELNDEFIEELGEDFKSVDELRKVSRERLESQYKMEADNRFHADFTQQLLDANPFEIPRILVNNYLDHIVEDTKRRDPNLNEDMVRQHYQAEAEFTIKWHYLKDKIAAAIKIEVSDSDTDKFLEELKDDKIREFYKSNPQIMERAKEDILNKKVIDHIVSKSKVNENEIKLD